MDVTVFWDVALCGLVEFYRRFGGACCICNEHSTTPLKLFRTAGEGTFGMPSAKVASTDFFSSRNCTFPISLTFVLVQFRDLH
jgi:hypothetical protein